MSINNFQNETENPSQVTISNAAADKILSLIQEEENSNLNLRVYISGGGCSGYQYGFTFDEEIQADDTIIEKICSDNRSKIKLLIDCMSVTLLTGAEIDFTSGIQEQFVIKNPNAKTTCGCGSSFSVADDEDLV
jgi:iron-sulfur cluster insertion protein